MRNPSSGTIERERIFTMKEKLTRHAACVAILKALKGRTLDGLSNKELCEAIDETPVNITRAIAVLESEGFLLKLLTGN
ncbi:MAG: hypothetical protein ACLR5Y_06390 [Haemophilus parainfluenzae]